MRIKRVQIEVMTPDNKRVFKRIRIVPPRTVVKGVEVKNYWTPADAEAQLEEAITSIDNHNPGHRYSLVSIGHFTYRLVWDNNL